MEKTNSVIIEIRAGVGGDEAGLFSSDLFRAYSRFAQGRGWTVSPISRSEGDLGNLKDIAFEISSKLPSPNLYRLFQNESGVHRVQRTPKTEKSGRIHTSTVTVAVLPVTPPVKININPQDLKFESFRASSKGGQNVQKVSTAVRLTHLPTGIVAACQEERSQFQNRERALRLLQSKLYATLTAQKKESIDELRRGQVGEALRSEKIKTYNFPQDRLTDHRTGKSRHNLEKIMDGNLEEILAVES